jgi:hypothetical protein
MFNWQGEFSCPLPASFLKKDHPKVAQYRVERMLTLDVGLKTIS